MKRDESPASDDSRRRRILVAEDDDDLREVLSMILQEHGYTVVTAPSLDAALREVDRQTFGFVVSDLLVRVDGDLLQSAEHLREHAFPTPVGLLTGWRLSASDVVNRGFAWLLEKPFEIERLVTEIAAQLETPLTGEDQRQAEIVRAYFAALSARDWGGLTALCADDVVYVLPAPAPYAGEVSGKEAFRSYTEETYRHFPSARFEGVRVYALPEGLVARYTGRWQAPDGEDRQQAGAVVFRFAGDKIKQIGVRLNAQQLQTLTAESGGSARPAEST